MFIFISRCAYSRCTFNLSCYLFSRYKAAQNEEWNERYALVIAGCVFGASSIMANAIRLDNQTDADIVVSCDNYAYQASLL